MLPPNKREPKDLIGNDILLNLTEISIDSQNAMSSTCAGVAANFYFKYKTKHGYAEDPELEGTILNILKVSKNADGTFIFKVKAKKKRFLKK